MRLGKTTRRRTPENQIILERHMIGLIQVLALDLNRCVGCRDCQVLCPTKAISSSEPVVESGALQRPIRPDVDPGLCHFCGQCAVLCPTKALSWRENDQLVPELVSNGMLPLLEESIDIRIEKCNADCRLVCQTSCPVDALQVEIESDPDAPPGTITAVNVDRARCFYCHKCERACPYGAITVSSARDGIVLLSPADCPEGCQACTEICPSGALYLENGRVELAEALCIFCRACQNVCPVDRALEIKRERIRHSPVRSQLWVEIQAKLVSESAKLRLLEETAMRKRDRAYRTRID